MRRRGISGVLRLVAALVLAWFAALSQPILPPGAAAQEQAAQKTLDFDAWDKTASRAEDIIQKAEASSPALESLRGQLVEFRSRALEVQNQNQARIDTLKSQIAALGPAPAEGATEADEVARRRVELNEQLAKTMAPVLAAQEAYRRANGLIGEIDKIIRDRLADQLLTLGVSPLNPVHWSAAFEAVVGLSEEIGAEISQGLNSETQKILTRQNLPVSLALIVLGLVLLTRARGWLLKAFGLMPAARSAPVSDMRAILISTTQVIVPMLGIAALAQGLQATGLVGLRGGMVLSALPMMGLAYFGGRWLARTLFTTYDETPLFFNLTDADNRRARRYAALMGVVLAASILLGRIAESGAFQQQAVVVLSFPIVLIAGLLLLRMGALLDPGRPAIEPPDNPLQRRVLQLIARTTIALGLAAPVLAAIGYYTASTSFVFPAILSLAVFGAGLIFYRLLADLAESLLASALQRRGAETGEQRLSLVPVALGFFLFIAAVPLLALIWGARVSDLLEVWSYVNDGFAIGDSRITARSFLLFVLVFSIGYTATRLLQSALRTSVLPRTSLDTGGRNAILTGAGYVGIFLAAVIAISTAGIDLSNLAIVAGALSVGIGFGLQAVVSNFVSGIILLVERPIKEGDWVEVGPHSGYIRKISVRATEIDTFDRATVIVPNADFISGAVINWTHSSMNGRVRVPIGVAYGTDPRLVEKILLEIANAHHMVDHRTKPNVVFIGFGADSMDFEIRAILKDVNWVLAVKSDMNFAIVERFAEAGIEIPFSQRDINLKNLPEISKAVEAALISGRKPTKPKE